MYKIIFSLILFALSSISNAAVVWNESIDGDLNSTNIGVLGEGTHTIMGSSFFNMTGGWTNDDDYFLFQLDVGHAITGFSYSDLNVVQSGGASSFDGSAVIRDNTTYDSYLVYGSGYESFNNWVFPFASSNQMHVNGSGYSGSCCTGSFTWDWSVDITVASPVPVPAAGWLFISALVGLVGKKRLVRR